jgi:hypothetical protein
MPRIERALNKFNRDFSTAQVKTLEREACMEPHTSSRYGEPEKAVRVAEEEINDHPPDPCALRCGLLGLLESAGRTPQPVTRLGIIRFTSV